MTGVHRHAKGVPDDIPRVRARVVINTPALSASQPVEQLAASSANALGHAITALTSTRSSAIARAVALEATSRIRGAWATDQPDRHELALGALLAGWAVDRSGLGPHHALSQTAVRIGDLAHADVNAALLPHTIKATRDRAPDTIDVTLVTLAENLRDRAGVTALGPFADNNELLDRAVEMASHRSELEHIPPALTAPEIREIYLAAH
jgi:maleylacetate reductase